MPSCLPLCYHDAVPLQQFYAVSFSYAVAHAFLGWRFAPSLLPGRRGFCHAFSAFFCASSITCLLATFHIPVSPALRA